MVEVPIFHQGLQVPHLIISVKKNLNIKNNNSSLQFRLKLWLKSLKFDPIPRQQRNKRVLQSNKINLTMMIVLLMLKIKILTKMLKMMDLNKMKVVKKEI